VVSKARKYVDLVVVIDDGSHDGTVEAARVAGAQVINHSTNRGYGEAIKSCFEAAKANAADVLVTLDGDGQHNPDELPLILAPILKGQADLVIGSRFLQPTQQTQSTMMPRYRKFGISVITWLWNLGSRTKVSDAQSGFRAYSRELFQNFSLAERGMSISIETLEKARRKKAIIKDVPISCFYGSSTLNLKASKHGISVALSVVRIRLKNSLFGMDKEA
jgi:glycosyltransferase involved in cell wall biosynthesis